MRYASRTAVPIDRTKAEIERELRRYGASEVMTAWSEHRAVVMFTFQARTIRFDVPMPTEADVKTPTGRCPRDLRWALSQAERQRWRALLLGIIAKLEFVESGLTSFDQEFLAHFVLPNGSTFGEWAIPQVEKSLGSGEMPAPIRRLLGAGRE